MALGPSFELETRLRPTAKSQRLTAKCYHKDFDVTFSNGKARNLKTLFRFSPELCLLIGLLVLTGCAGTNKTGSSSQANSTEAVPTAKVYSIMDDDLADLVIQFLATSKTKDPRTHEERRQALALGIADYLAASGHAQAHTLKFNREGMTFLLPVQFVSLDAIHSSSESDLFLADKKTIPSNLRGEILDLAWLPDRRRDSGRLLALFADSLAIVAPSDGHCADLSFEPW